MELEEALKKYSINVPDDETFYSKEYQEYFRGNKKEGTDTDLERFREFDQMYKKSFLVTFGESQEKTIKDSDRRAVVLGGQTGAGKSGLVNMIMRDARMKGKVIYLIDDDQFRKFYPYYDDIMAECPEYSTILTAKGSGPITPKIMKYASDRGLNFIFDGTMKNTRILDTARSWENYDISYKVMATSRMESLISIFERNAYLRQNGFGRPITVDEHDATYYGIEDTIKKLEENTPEANIEIYMRGKDKTSMPRLIYAPRQKGMYKNATEALRIGRENDKKRILGTDIYTRIDNLEAAERILNPKEKEELLTLKSALREAIEER